jgi:competence protein ComEC
VHPALLQQEQRTTPTPPRPAIIVFILVAIGIAGGHAAPTLLPAWVWLAIAVTAAACSLILPRHAVRPLLAAAAVTGGAGWCVARAHTTPANHLSHALTETPRLITVDGVVTTTPQSRPSQRGRLAPFARHTTDALRFELRTDHAIDDSSVAHPVRGTLYVRVAADTPDPPRAGDRIRITGFATAIRAPGNPGELDMRPLATQRDIAGAIRLSTPDLIAPPETHSPLRSRIAAAHARIIGAARQRATRVLPDDVLLRALLLGQRDHRFHDLSQPYLRSGVAHILAISGLHLALLCGIVVLGVRLFGDRPRLETVVLISTVVLMLLLVPARAPIVRAGAIIVGLRAAEQFGRRYDPLNTLAWIAVAMLLWKPLDLFSPGFHLSFGIVAALLTLVRPLQHRLFGPPHDPDHRTRARWIFQHLHSALCVSLVAWLVSTPIVAYHFGLVSLAAPLTTLAILPIVTILVGLGWGLVLLGLITPDLAHLTAGALAVPAAALTAVVNAFDAIPHAAPRLPRISLALTIGATLCAVAIARYGMLRQPRVLAALAVLAIWTTSEVRSSRLPSDVALRLDTLSVGDGSAHLLRAGNDALLFDCGSSWFGIGQRTIPDAIRALGTRSVPTVILSHPDTDHYAGLLDSIEPLGVRTVLVGPTFRRDAAANPDGPTAFVLQELDRAGITIRVVEQGDTVPLGNHLLRFVHPPPDFAPESDNDASLVALIEVEPTGRRIMLCADIERQAMEALAPLELRADIMNAPHHGSARDFAFDFVEDVDPSIVLQSTGPSRLGDERWDDVKRARRWYITARDGAVCISILDDGSIRSASFRRR